MRANKNNKNSGTWIGGIAVALTATAIAVGTPIREVQAQPTDPGQIQELLEQARQLYNELLPVAQRLGDESLLTRLRALNARWLEARGHMQGRRYRQAGTLAKRNLEQLRELSATVRKMAQRLPYYNRMAERNVELLQLLRRNVGPGAPPEIQRQLTLAADAVERARRVHTRGNTMQAFRLMEQSETMLRQVLRFVGRTGLTAETVQREVEETERRIERFTALPDIDPQSSDAFERARTLQEEAKSLLASGDLQQTLTRTLTARTALRLAERLSGGRLTAEDIAAAIAHTEELQEIHEELATSEHSAVRSLWEQAERQLNQARILLNNGRLRPALESAQNAAKLIVTASRRAAAIPPSPATEPAFILQMSGASQ
jgi:hypothetical protein